MEDGFRGGKRLSDDAAALAISRQRLNAACKSATGATASEMLHDRVMLEAKRALVYTAVTGAEIGHDVGFDDPAYFNRFFTRRMGIAPGKWRAQFTATEIAPPGRTSE